MFQWMFLSFRKHFSEKFDNFRCEISGNLRSTRRFWYFPYKLLKSRNCSNQTWRILDNDSKKIKLCEILKNVPFSTEQSRSFRSAPSNACSPQKTEKNLWRNLAEFLNSERWLLLWKSGFSWFSDWIPKVQTFVNLVAIVKSFQTSIYYWLFTRKIRLRYSREGASQTSPKSIQKLEKS